MNKVFPLWLWEDSPSINTPLAKRLLNLINNALSVVDDRVIIHDTTKANQTDMLKAITSVSLDESTGIFTFTRHNGTTITVDTKLEKIVLNYRFDSQTQTLYLILEDGTEIPVDLSSFVTNVEFKDSTTIRYSITDGGKVTFDIIDGSITGDKLEPNYLANVQLASTSASQSAESAEASAVRAEEAAERAESVSDVDIATTEKAGIVKPDGITITISEDGTISAQASSGGGITVEELNKVLANYLPLDGAIPMPQRLFIGTGSLDNVTTLSMQNKYRQMYWQVLTDGRLVLVDGTNGGIIMKFSADGQTNTFRGTATENLLLSGGTLSGTALSLLALNNTGSNTELLKYVGIDGILGYLGFDGANTPVFADANGSPRLLLHTGNFSNYALAKDGGGTVQKASALPMGIKNTVSDACYFNFIGKSGSLGSLGFNGADVPVYVDKATNTAKGLIHTGTMAYYMGAHKPSGTYTGNGSSTERTIATGGIGNMLLLYSDNIQGQAIVTPLGAFTFENNEVNLYDRTKLYYENGTMHMTNTEVAFNKSGTTYTYHCI